MGPEAKDKLTLRCFHCGASYLYSKQQIGDEGIVHCQNCGTRFNFPEDPVLSGVGAELKQEMKIAALLMKLETQ